MQKAIERYEHRPGPARAVHGLSVSDERRGHGPRHRRLRRRPGHRGPRRARATRSRRRTRSSRSSPTRRRWTCPSPLGGRRRRSSRSAVGDTVSEGTLLLTLSCRRDGAGPSSRPTGGAAGRRRPRRGRRAGRGRGRGRRAEAAAAAPAARRAAAAEATAAPPLREPGACGALARELGVDLAQVTGTGRKGRILKDDVEAAPKAPRRRPRPPRRRRAAAAAWSCCRGRRSTSRSSAPVERVAAVADQEASRARTCTATG